MAVSAPRAAPASRERTAGAPAVRQETGAPAFRVLTARDLAARAKRRRARAVYVGSGVVVIGSLLAIAIGEALVSSQQIRLDQLEQRLSAAVAQNQELQLERAQLASPARILDLAKRQLGMVAPSSVTYLPAVLPGQLTGAPVAPLVIAPAQSSAAAASSSSPTTTSAAGSATTGATGGGTSRTSSTPSSPHASRKAP